MENNQQSIHKTIRLKIQEYRGSRNIPQAILECQKAIHDYENDYFYPKMMGDLFMEQKNFSQAADAYLLFLKRMKPQEKLFSDFRKRYHRLKKSWSFDEIKAFKERLLSDEENRNFHFQITTWIEDLIKKDGESVTNIGFRDDLDLSQLLQDDVYFSQAIQSLKVIEKDNPHRLKEVLDQYIFNREERKKSYKIDSYCISLYERLLDYKNALSIARELYLIKKDLVIIRTIFRICRKLKDYTITNEILKEDPKILRDHSFHILYELVYYYEYHENIEESLAILKRIERSGQDSTPIQKTVKNFYLSFGKLDDVRRVEEKIGKLAKEKKKKPHSKKEKSDKKYLQEASESEARVGSKIQELYSELEHNKHLAAISDLTMGISHELGQPITNIRYTIQFYEKMFQEVIPKKEVLDVFHSILEETKRMGSLVSRLSPLTSSKNTIEEFDLINQVEKRVNGAESQLFESSISVSLSPKTPIYLFGDSTHFDQIINNLLFNAIDSINEEKAEKRKEIVIRVVEESESVLLYFSDTGVGIKPEHQRKIFNPFFTTKGPGKGEGLGLFIIWKLLAVHGGKIELDAEYEEGTRFVITIPKKSQYRKGI